MRPLYKGKPGQSHADPRPVVYRVEAMKHITDAHPERVGWIEANTEAIRGALERPDIVY